MKNFLLNTTGGFVLLLLLLIGTRGSMLFNGLAIGAAAGLVILIKLGPDKVGIGFMMLGTFLAPINALKLGAGGNITYADFAYVLGVGLLVPKLLRSKSKMPRLYTWGMMILVANALVVSLLAPTPVASLTGFIRVIWAMLVIPVVLHRLQMSRQLLYWFVWTYVFAQACSIVKGMTYAGILGGGRSAGYTTHPDFFGLAGQLAFAMCVFLFYRTPKNYRWIVVGAAAFMALGVFQSGSRASLLCIAATVILWPLVERTAVSVYIVLSFAAVVAVAANYLIENAPPGSALDRLKGGGTAQGSSLARQLLLSSAWKKFLEHPIKGGGWVTDILAYHNVYLEVGIAGGVLAILGFVLVVASTIKPLFDEPVPNRLAFMGVSYAMFAALGPTLYDRVLWGGLALVFALHHAPDEPVEDDDTRIRRSQRRGEKPDTITPVPAMAGRQAPPDRPRRTV
jgi:O-antigen ligase